MIGIIALALVALVAFQALRMYQRFSHNLAEAKKSNIPYIIVPVYPHYILWLIVSKLVRPQLKKLPKTWTSPWLDFMDAEFCFNQGHKPFAERDCDLLLLVSPQHNLLLVADADAISQITHRRVDFPKPTEIYGSLEIFGRNLVTLEGQYWRQHRKIAAPSFGEKNNWLVWTEALHQAKEMTSTWMNLPEQTVDDVTVLTMRLALHIICRAGFGVSMVWPEEEERMRAKGEEIEGFTSNTLAPGHQRSYKDAVEGLLDGLILNMLVPPWLLKRLPWKKTHEAYVCRNEWATYMDELFEQKVAEARDGQAKVDGMDLMGNLVRGSGIATTKSPSTPLLTKDEIIGNSFVFMIAGHETSSNAMVFSMLYLAMQPWTQRALQADIDRIVGTKPVNEWDYEDVFPKLFGGHLGAVMNETLRIVPSVTAIPKSASKTSPQALTLSTGRRVVVPAGCRIYMDSPALHRNPRYWPAYTDPNTGRSSPNDIHEFRPERWLLVGETVNGGTHATDTEESLDDGGPSGPDTSASLFKPQKGSYIPFSEGFRSCIGRRFSQVETLASLAYLFKFYSIELAVEESDKEVMGIEMQERRGLWEKARGRAEGLLKTNMETKITLQMRDETVRLRLVRRGEERFGFEEPAL